jgi:hypothetical protein
MTRSGTPLYLATLYLERGYIQHPNGSITDKTNYPIPASFELREAFKALTEKGT